MTNEEATSEIIMLTREHNCPSINPIREQIRKAVAKNRYNWQVARIEEEGNIIIE
jgi:metal-sulfur cluster biosynthetic enzyme